MTRALAGSSRRTYLIIAAAALLVLGALIPSAIDGSSHREAPLIAADPTADNTDLYAWRTDGDTVTIAANYIPLQEPNGGPNFTNFSDNVLYEIKVDNSGDARSNVTYQFRFKTTFTDSDLFGETYLYNDFPLETTGDPDQLYTQTYTVTRVAGKKSTVVGSGVVPPTNIGPRSTPQYAPIRETAITSLSNGGKAFAGPRDDAFFVDLGSIFDLGGLRPFNGAHLLPLAAEPGVDGVGGFNVHTISIQVPITDLTGTSTVPELGSQDAVIGLWATASRQKVTVLRDGQAKGSGPWTQVSRLGNPLINEVVIPLDLKDSWNFSAPENDSRFVEYYLNPSLARIVNTIYPPLVDARESGRDDLVAILLTGLTVPPNDVLGNTEPLIFTQTGTVLADMLRLNVAVPPCPSSCSTLGVMGGDLAGFPNGRRLTDDVTDIEIRAIIDGYGSVINGIFGDLTPNNSPNNAVGDGVNENDVPFLSTFPFQADPHSGYAHQHHAVGTLTPPEPV
ncbi:MAG: DUF4331 domain-containing protein [Candidatus Limnocylindria bacterium]